MNPRIELAIFNLITLALIASCTRHESKYTKINPAKLEKRDGETNPFIVLTLEAEKRLDIQVDKIGQVHLVQGKRSFQFPASSILYDTFGKTWVYVRQSDTSSQSVYHRVEVELIKVDRKVAFVAADKNGQTFTTYLIVSVGAAELLGTESGVGK